MKGDDMTRNQRKNELGARAAGGSDFTGLLPFGLGIFLAIVLLMGLLRPPEGQPLGSAAVASAVQRSVGVPAALWFALVLCLLGGRWFLAGRSQGFLRNLAGSTGIAIGIALLAGGLVQGLGGNFGDLPRRLMGESAGRVAGASLGLLLSAASAWVAWLAHGSLLLARKIETSTTTPVRLGSKAPGVTEEEAEALLPPAPLDEDAELGAPAVLPLSSPYPEDVRKRGEIPAGARPISPLGEPLDEPRRTPQAAQQPGEDDSPGLYRWTPKAPANAVQPAGRDLAEPAPGPREVAAPARPEPAAAPAEGGAELRALARGAELEAPASATGPQPLPPRPQDLASGVRPVATASAPPRPSWEAAALVQEQLFEEAAEEQEESIARSLGIHEDPPAPRPASPVAAVEAPEEVEALPEDDRSELDAELEELLGGSLDEEGDEAEGEEESEEDLEEPEDSLFADLDEEDVELEEELEEELDEEELEEPAEVGSRAQASEDDWEEESEEESEEELVAEEAELADAAFAEDQGAPEGEAVAAPAGARASDGEREVVLEPKAPPAGAQRKLSDVVVQAGCLFLERERVAVSMLQRQFGLDFEQSCAVLDELQESGLIGPYLGGQSRDILMTRDEWLRKVGQA